MLVNVQKATTGEIGGKKMKRISQDELDGYTVDECIYNPMTGYAGRYEYAHFIGEAEQLENGKFQYTYYKTVWSGDAEDNGLEYDCDKGETTIFAQKEFDTLEEMEEWSCCEVTLEYQGNTEQTYAGGVDHDEW